MIRELHAKDDKFFQTDKTHSLVGSKDLEIPEAFKPYTKMIINTTTYNAFYRTPLESELNKIKPRRVYLVGLETHTFIMFTAEELRNRGYEVSLIEPLTTAEDEYLHGLGITMLRNFLAVDIEQ
jgi:nicotinamidase-related amidase